MSKANRTSPKPNALGWMKLMAKNKNHGTIPADRRHCQAVPLAPAGRPGHQGHGHQRQGDVNDLTGQEHMVQVYERQHHQTGGQYGLGYARPRNAKTQAYGRQKAGP